MSSTRPEAGNPRDWNLIQVKAGCAAFCNLALTRYPAYVPSTETQQAS
jgi:hypothetical protein